MDLTNPTPAAETTASPGDGESQEWAKLEKDFGDAGAGGSVADVGDADVGDTTSTKASDKTAESDADDKDLPPEVLKERYRQLRGALKEERETRKAESERNKNMQELLRQLAEQRTKPAESKPAAEPQTPTIPDINDDPIGHFQAKTALLEQRLADLHGRSTQTQQQISAEREQRQFWAEIDVQETEFKRSTPDYMEATTHLETARMNELRIMFPDEAPGAMALAREHKLSSVEELRWAMLNADRISIAQQARRVGVNAGELYYNLARQRGYQPKSAAPPKASLAMTAAKAGQGAVNASRSGAVSDNDMTWDDIADLYLTDPAAADKEFQKMSARARAA